MFEKKNSVGETVSVLREVQDTAWDSKVINMYKTQTTGVATGCRNSLYNGITYKVLIVYC